MGSEEKGGGREGARELGEGGSGRNWEEAERRVRDWRVGKERGRERGEG